MNEQEALAWLGRRIGWGFTAERQSEWQAFGVATVLDRLTAPDTNGVPERPDPFADVVVEPDNVARSVRAGVLAWVDSAVESPRPLETFMEFFWSDYFAVSIALVRPPTLMFDHMNLLARHALGNFGDLLRDITVDPAMLKFLDGTTNTAERPNENYGRELLELYSVGVGNFTEDDVLAAARALTGWVVPRGSNQNARFVDDRHDDEPQTLLGVSGVHDVDTVIAAVLEHPATAERVVRLLAEAIVGPDHDASMLPDLVAQFRSDYEIRPVVQTLLELALAGNATPSVVEPFPWFVMAQRLTGSEATLPNMQEYFRTSGQIPLAPPNVGGFPGPETYLSTSATIARFNLASHLAERSRNRTALVELTEDLDAFAARLGVPGGFEGHVRLALESLAPGMDRVAAALVSPDVVVV